MTNLKNVAGLIGPSLIAITIYETVNIHIWAGNTAAGIHFNGAVLPARTVVLQQVSVCDQTSMLGVSVVSQIGANECKIVKLYL